MTPQPTFIDRRHPAWGIAFARALDVNLTLDEALDYADLAYLKVRQRDHEQADALAAHRAELQVAHQKDVNQIAIEWHNKLFASLDVVQKDEIRAFVARREFEAAKTNHSPLATNNSPLTEAAV